jgi:ABC-type antimicrobial peptide transport system permease subunit
VSWSRFDGQIDLILVRTRRAATTSLLYDVKPTDPVTSAAVVAGLALTVLAACCGPALMASRVDPAIALRSE